MVLTGFFGAAPAGASATNLADANAAGTAAAADPDNGRKPTSSMPTAHTSEKSGGSAAAAAAARANAAASSSRYNVAATKLSNGKTDANGQAIPRATAVCMRTESSAALHTLF